MSKRRFLKFVIFTVFPLLAILTALLSWYSAGKDKDSELNILSELTDSSDEKISSQPIKQTPGDSLLSLIIHKGEMMAEQNVNIQDKLYELEQFVYECASMDVEDSLKADFFRALAMYAELYDDNALAFRSTEKITDYIRHLSISDSLQQVADLYYTLAVYSNRMGNAQTASELYLKSIEITSRLPEIPLEKIYFSYSALANMFWYELRYDSSEFYFTKALEAVEQLPPEPINLYYRKALLNNGLMVIYKENGQFDKAISLGYEVIDDYRRFIENCTDEKLIKNALTSEYQVMDNLATAYESMGNLKRGLALKQYSRRQKEKAFGESFHGIFQSDILLGNSFVKLKKYSEANEYLNRGIEGLNSSGDDHTFWLGDAYYAMAIANLAENKRDEAKKVFEMAEQYYSKAYGNTMDNIYADFLRELGLFLAREGDYDKAVRTFRQIKDFLDNNSEKNYIEYYYYYHRLSNIDFYSGNYQNSINSADRAAEYIQKQFQNRIGSVSGPDSVKIGYFLPDILLLKAKAEYEMNSDRDIPLLKKLSQSLDSALQMVERRKYFIREQDDISAIMEDHKELFGFSSKINLELIEKTDEQEYKEKFIVQREHALYSKIRNRINYQKAIRFSGIPDSVLNEETRLKTLLSNFSKAENEKFDGRKADSDWNIFLTNLKQNFPEYYRLMYHREYNSLLNIKNMIPNQTTMVRYYLSEDKLVVWIADAGKENFLILPVKNLRELIENISADQISEYELTTTLSNIYQLVWEPVEPLIETEKVIIIPDEILYRINMEMLPTAACNNYEELSELCLLRKHTFSLLYSPLLLDEPLNTHDNFDCYIGFTPGFSDKLKANYISRLPDSVYLDHTYLELLPQPISSRLAKKFKQKFNGKLYFGNASTINNFIENADCHKVIHIATHAEFNNIYPEQSGLYFTKTGTDKHFFTISDIFQAKTNSDLTILTACESGRPGYSDGEGLVSLSHAFNYAGSKNILTAIWEIDENSSTAITDYFVQYLTKGKATDEALRLAKLQYLQNARGRMLNPAYWSGLVLMGQPLQIDLTADRKFTFTEGLWWKLLILIFAGGLIYYYRN